MPEMTIEIEEGNSIRKKVRDKRVEECDFILNFEMKFKSKEAVKEYLETLDFGGYRILHIHWYPKDVHIFLKYDRSVGHDPQKKRMREIHPFYAKRNKRKKTKQET